MSGAPAIGNTAPGGLRGLLRSWLKTPSAGFQDSAPAEDRVSGWPGALRLLVVDDEPANLMLISAQLEARGLSPWLAADGAEAVTLACETPFDLILMDLQMPYLDGLQATMAIRRFEARHGLAPAPVLAWSSRTLGDELLRAAGMDGRLSKPCLAAELDDCLKRWSPAQGSGATNTRVSPAKTTLNSTLTRTQSGAPLR